MIKWERITDGVPNVDETVLLWAGKTDLFLGWCVVGYMDENGIWRYADTVRIESYYHLTHWASLNTPYPLE